MISKNQAAKITAKITKTAKKFKLDFVRLFGSGVKNLEKARDVDLLVGKKALKFKEYTLLIAEFEEIFGKTVDLVQLKPGISAVLVCEISRHSISLYEEPKNGRLKYFEEMERYHAIAEDEILANKYEPHALNIKRRLKELKRISSKQITK